MRAISETEKKGLARDIRQVNAMHEKIRVISRRTARMLNVDEDTAWDMLTCYDVQEALDQVGAEVYPDG